MSESDSDEYEPSRPKSRKARTHPRKRRRLSITDNQMDFSEENHASTLIDPLLEVLAKFHGDENFIGAAPFDLLSDAVLPGYLQTREELQNNDVEEDDQGRRLRTLTRSEVSSFIDTYNSIQDPFSTTGAITLRQLKLRRERRKASFENYVTEISPGLVESLPLIAEKPPANHLVLDALSGIRSTPFENSFLSRIHGGERTGVSSLLAVDRETVTPWMSLMSDIREHYSLLHPERDQSVANKAPITYMSLQTWHLDQVHDLLARSFWSGINVSDSLDYSPERCTVVATYKKVVVGVAILSSPRETYITYLAVKHGWDNAQIATSMLYHLINLNPGKDITLHVSANNSAMLLYNRFGFKAEEFIAGFYEDYYDPQSRMSTNAFRLRLRHL